MRHVPQVLTPAVTLGFTYQLSGDKRFIRRIMACGHIDRLNVGPIETFKLSWDQPHEGNLFELLYRQRAFQIEHPEPEAMVAFP